MRRDGKIVAKIKVIGVGGAGSNTLNDMIASGDVKSIEFVAMNTDMQDLIRSKAQTRIQLGEKITKGLGAGANPEVGKLSAKEDADNIRTALTGTDLLFITAGMGGGTGTGAAPMVAKMAKELGILTAAIVTKPFTFEGEKRAYNANLGIEELNKYVDTLVVIPNDRLLELPDREITLINAFEEVNKILKIGMKSIADLITNPGYINLDYADVKTIMSKSGIAMLGFGYAEGEDRAKRATEEALTSPLLERPVAGAKRVLINITGGVDFALKEANQIANIISEATNNSMSEVIFGTVLDEQMGRGIQVTVIATDFSNQSVKSSDGKVSYDRIQVAPVSDRVEVGSDSSQDENLDLLEIPTIMRQNNKINKSKGEF